MLRCRAEVAEGAAAVDLQLRGQIGVEEGSDSELVGYCISGLGQLSVSVRMRSPRPAAKSMAATGVAGPGAAAVEINEFMGVILPCPAQTIVNHRMEFIGYIPSAEANYQTLAVPVEKTAKFDPT